MKKILFIAVMLLVLVIAATAQAGTVGDMFDKLISRFGADVEGMTIVSVNVESNKNYIRLEDPNTAKEYGILLADDGSFVFYWEQVAKNAQSTVDAITGGQ